MTFNRAGIAALALIFMLAGCGGKTASAPYVSPYAKHDCPRLFKEMEHTIGEAKYLFTNTEDEDSVGKAGTGVLMGAAGAAMASSLVLTPLGWVLAGGLMLGGASDVVDGIAHDELSDAEQRRLVAYKGQYDEMRKIATEKKCDYYKIPVWDVP